ncbi:MAG: indolepyruvate oxidoreductase subunit beta [bacterium]
MTPTQSNPRQVTRIFVAGVGGQGTITATIVIGEAAIAAGLNVVTSELPGMAQRGGIVNSEIVVGDAYTATIPNGSADVILGFEPAETVRCIAKAAADKTITVVNTRPVVPVSASQGVAQYPTPDEVTRHLAQASHSLISLDAVALATQAGAPKAMGAVMVGVLAGLNLLPIPHHCWTTALNSRAPTMFREANLRAFELGVQVARAMK